MDEYWPAVHSGKGVGVVVGALKEDALALVSSTLATKMFAVPTIKERVGRNDWFEGRKNNSVTSTT